MGTYRRTALHGTLTWNPETLRRELDYRIYSHYRPYSALRLSVDLPKQSTLIIITRGEYHYGRYDKTDGFYPFYAEKAQTFHSLIVLDLSGRLEVIVYTKGRKADGPPDHQVLYSLDPAKRRPVRWMRPKKMVLRLVEDDELTEKSPVTPPPPAHRPARAAVEPAYPPNSLFADI